MLDIKNEIATELIKASIGPLGTLKVSTLVTKKGIAEKFDRHFGNKSASDITHAISVTLPLIPYSSPQFSSLLQYSS